jgi:rubrerythrin
MLRNFVKRRMMMPENEKLIKIFEFALNQEETGKNFFQSSLERMGIGAAVTAFKRLIREEEHHIEFISRILEKLREGNEPELAADEGTSDEKVDFFDERAKSEFLDRCIEGSMVPDVTVFNTAWLIEKDLSEYYEKMASKTEGKAREALMQLSKWEKAHEKFFRDFRDRLSEVYANMPWGG